MQKRMTDKKNNRLVLIERHEKDNPELPKYTTFYCKLDNGTAKGSLRKVGSSREGLNINTMRQRVADLVEKSQRVGTSQRTLQEVYESYVLELKADGKDAKFFVNYIYPHCFANKQVCNFLHKRLVDITTEEVRSWFNNIAIKSASKANGGLALIKRLYNIAVENGEVLVNVPAMIKKKHIAPRLRYLDVDERVKFFDVMENIVYRHSPQGAAWLWLLIFTGARKMEIGNLRWSQIDGNVATIENHKTAKKTGQAKKIYFSDAAMKVLNSLPRTEDKVFTIREPRYAWNILKERMGKPDLRIHDLRRTVATVAINNGIDSHRVMAITGHKDPKMLDIYASVEKDTTVSDINYVSSNLLPSGSTL